MVSFGNATTREMANVARETARAEKSGESMARQLQRQAETFGKSASEIRNMRAEMRALDAEQRGLTELAGRIRGLNAEMNRLEAAGGRGAASMGSTRAAMQGLSFQAQDAFTQISMGTNVLTVLAIQGGQAAGQMTYMGGTLGKVANFMVGPWGLAITAGMLVLGSLTKGLFDNEEASDKAKKGALDLTSAIDFQSMSVRDLADAIDELEKAQSRQLVTARQSEIQALKNAEAALKEATANRQKAIATLQALNADQSVSLNRMAGEDLLGAIPAGYQQIQAAMGATKRDIDALTKAAGAAERLVRETKIPIMTRQVTEATDAAAAATGRFERSIESLSARFTAGKLTEAQYIQETTRLNRQHKAELDAISEAEKAGAGSKREAAKASREAANAAREQKKAYDELLATLDKIEGRFDPARKAAKDFGSALNDIDRLVGANMLGSADALIFKIAAAGEAAEAEAKRAKDQFAKITGYTMGSAEDPVEKLFKAWDKSRSDEDAAGFAAKQRNLNDSLTFTADLWELIARNANIAGQGMADAFGKAGAALGDMASIFAGYRADQERLAAVHQTNMNNAATEAARQREIAKYNLATSTAQIGLFGDMTSAAKGFFNEKSKGYKALHQAEQVFRAFEFAMSVRAMAQNVAETLGIVSNSAARATAEGTAGIAAQSKLPFPFNIVAMSATAAALIAAGVAVVGAVGGGSSKLPTTNTGTGTVFGDSEAKSESIKRSLDALKDVDIVGSHVDLGITETGVTVGITDYSRKDTDDFGATRIVPRAWAKRMTVRSQVPSVRVDAIQRALAGLRARPALYIGEDGFDSLAVYGFSKDFSIDLQCGDASYCSFTIEGLI